MHNATKTHVDGNAAPVGVRSIVPPIVLLCVTCLIIFWTLDYGVTARRLPLIIGSSTLLLLILDLISRFRGRIPAWLRRSLGAGFQDREMQHNLRWHAEVVQVGWLLCCVIAMALFGILITIPLFVFLYLVLQGRRKIGFSLLVAALVVVAVGFVFEFALEYELYRGMLLNRDGFE